MSSSSLSQGPWAIAFLGVASLVLLWLSLWLRRRERLIRDLPNSKVQGVFIGLVELKVTAESEKPLTSFLSAQVCVQYAYTVEEHWSRTVTESYTDDKGQAQTRTKAEEGWTTVASGGAPEPFYGRDDTGVIMIRPQGATFEAANFFDRTATAAEPFYREKGPLAAIPNSTGRRHFKEEWIPLHAPLFVVGQARERQDVVAPEIAASKGAALFLISAKPQELLQTKYSAYSWLALAGGLAFAVAAGHFGRACARAGP
jgi:hypothetical protein